MKSVLLHVRDTMEPYEVKFTKPPGDWVEPDPNTEKGGGNFNKADNPCGWSSFSSCPVFASEAKGGQYKLHCLPAGFQPVPPNEDKSEICTHVGWTFFLTRVEEGGTQGWREGEYL